MISHGICQKYLHMDCSRMHKFGSEPKVMLPLGQIILVYCCNCHGWVVLGLSGGWYWTSLYFVAICLYTMGNEIYFGVMLNREHMSSTILSNSNLLKFHERQFWQLAKNLLFEYNCLIKKPFRDKQVAF